MGQRELIASGQCCRKTAKCSRVEGTACRHQEERGEAESLRQLAMGGWLRAHWKQNLHSS